MIIIGIKNNYVAVKKKGQKRMESLKKMDATEGLELSFYENQQGKLFGFKAVGYLNLASFGYDIYNAAFSQVFLGTINSILSLTNISEYSMEETNAFIRFVIPYLKDDYDEKVFLLFDSMFLQIQMVLEEMKVKEIENKVSINIVKIN